MVENSIHTAQTSILGTFKTNCDSLPQVTRGVRCFRNPILYCFSVTMEVSVYFLSVLTFAYFFIVSPVQAQSRDNSGHLAIDNAADISEAEANRIYKELKVQMARGYGMSGLKMARDYQSWKQFNSVPYISATHGHRFVNNFANRIGRAYGTLKEGERYPKGTVLAKDSITIMDSGKYFPGALFIMEKLKSGTNPDTADWRYVVVNPDGSLYGDTIGDKSRLVEYCHACHRAKSNQDYVFFIPEEFQAKQK